MQPQVNKETTREYNELLKSVQLLAERNDKKMLKMEEYFNRKIGKLNNYYDGLSKNTGEAVEEFFFNYFEDNPVINVIHFDKVVQNMKTADAEYDIVLTNGKYVAVIEVKHKFHPDDLVKFLNESLPKFRSEFPKYKKCKIIAGVASFVFPKETKERALRAGLLIYTQSGQNVKLVNGKNFMAKLY